MVSKRMHKYTMRKDNRRMAGGGNDLPVASRADCTWEQNITPWLSRAEKRIRGASQSSFFSHPATGDLFLIPSVALNLLSALCLCQPPFPHIHLPKFLSGFSTAFLFLQSTSVITASRRLWFPSCSLCFQFRCMLLLLPAAELRLLSSPSLFMVLSLRPGPLPETVKGHLLANLTGAAALASSR